MTTQEQKERYAKSISLFLAELLRTRRISLPRASDIAQKVLENINLIDTEEQFLKFVKVMSSDFEELYHLQDKISFDIQKSERRMMEDFVREFVIAHLSINATLACQVLQEAVMENASLDNLCVKFPQFKQFKEQK